MLAGAALLQSVNWITRVFHNYIRLITSPPENAGPVMHVMLYGVHFEENMFVPLRADRIG